METYAFYPGEGLAVVAQLRPTDRMAFVLNTVDPGGFDGAAQLVIRQWSEDSPDEVTSFYEDLSEADQERVRLPLVKGVASADAKRGAELAVALEPENAFLLVEIMNAFSRVSSNCTTWGRFKVYHPAEDLS